MAMVVRHITMAAVTELGLVVMDKDYCADLMMENTHLNFGFCRKPYLNGTMMNTQKKKKIHPHEEAIGDMEGVDMEVEMETTVEDGMEVVTMEPLTAEVDLLEKVLHHLRMGALGQSLRRNHLMEEGAMVDMVVEEM